MRESKESLKSDDLLLKFNFKCNKEKHFQNEKNKIVSSLTLFPYPHAKGNENNFHASIISLMPLSQTYFEQFFCMFEWDFVWVTPLEVRLIFVVLVIFVVVELYQLPNSKAD